MFRVESWAVGIEIEFSGLRPGEKLYEELLLAGEDVNTTSHKKICIAKAENFDEVVLNQKLESLFAAAKAMELQKVIVLLQQIVPEFTPTFRGHSKGVTPNSSSCGTVIPLVRQLEEK